MWLLNDLKNPFALLKHFGWSQRGCTEVREYFYIWHSFCHASCLPFFKAPSLLWPRQHLHFGENVKEILDKYILSLPPVPLPPHWVLEEQSLKVREGKKYKFPTINLDSFLFYITLIQVCPLFFPSVPSLIFFCLVFLFYIPFPILLFFAHNPLVVRELTKALRSSRWESFRIHSLDVIFETALITWHSSERDLIPCCVTCIPTSRKEKGNGFFLSW